MTRASRPPAGRRPPLLRALASALAALALAPLGSGGAAQGAALAPAEPAPSPLRAFLAALDAHPGILAADALVRAAEADLRAVRAPVAFEASGGLVRLRVEGGSEVLPPPLDDLLDDLLDVPRSGSSLRLGATFRPVPFGDLADLEAQRLAQLERARLQRRETRARLEAQALEAAAGVGLAEEGLELALLGRSVAEEALAAARLRAERGGAGAAEVARAEAALARARSGVAEAERSLERARRGLALLVGEDAEGARPAPPPRPTGLRPDGLASPELLRAALDLELARVGLRSAERALLPVAQAGYTWNLGDGGSSLSASIESRTLQPELSYRYAEGAAAQGGGGSVLPLPEGLAPTVRGTFTIGVSGRVSPELVHARRAAEARVAAAEAGLRAAAEAAGLTALSLADALGAARAEAELAALDAELAASEAADARRRVELGLASPLEARRAELDAARAALAARQADLALLRASLDVHRSYAVPVSEVLP